MIKKQTGGTVGWKDSWKRWGGWSGGKSCGQPATNYEEYSLSAAEWLRYGAEGIGICALISYTFYRSLPVFILSLPAGCLYPLFRRKTLKEERLFRLNQEFKEGILMLASNLSAGYSIENALAVSSQELGLLCDAGGMISHEFAAMARQLQMNRTVEQVFFEFADRSGLEDVKNFAQVLKAAKRSGGDLVAVIHHTAGVIRDKGQVREEIVNMTTSKKLEQKIMNLIPFFLIFYIDRASPGFFGMMYQTGMGRILMTVCLGVYGFAFWLSKRILDIPI